MGKDYSIITHRDVVFSDYLRNQVFHPATAEFVELLEVNNDVIVFSGVIRDYMLHRIDETIRDIDIVVAKQGYTEDMIGLIQSYPYRVNSFGGVKMVIGDQVLDLWRLEDTWGIRNEGYRSSAKSLVKTSFFNFSAIAYDLDEERFYIHKAFRRFLKDKRIDILYDKNPNVPLCIVNSKFYSERLGMPLGKNLKSWIWDHYDEKEDYLTVQLEHWGEVKYDKEVIRDFCYLCME